MLADQPWQATPRRIAEKMSKFENLVVEVGRALAGYKREIAHLKRVISVQKLEIGRLRFESQGQAERLRQLLARLEQLEQRALVAAGE